MNVCGETTQYRPLLIFQICQVQHKNFDLLKEEWFSTIWYHLHLNRCIWTNWELLEQNIDIPEITLIVHPEVAKIIKKAAEMNIKPTVSGFLLSTVCRCQQIFSIN